MENIVASLASTLGVPLTAVIVTAVGMVAVYVFVNSKMKKTNADTEEKQNSTKEMMAVLAQRVFTCEKRLDEGNAKFDALDTTLRSINSNIERLSGMVEMFFRSQGLGGK